MKHPMYAALLLLPLASLLPAQGEEKPAKQDPQAALNQLEQESDKAITAWREAAQEAVKEARASGSKTRPAILDNPPTREFVNRAMELAEEFEGTDDAVPFLGFAIKRASNEANAVKKAVRVLAAAHVESPKMADVVPFLAQTIRHAGPEAVEALLAGVAEKNPVADAKAHALFARAELLLERADVARDGGESLRARAKADLEKLAALDADAELVKAGKDLLFAVEHLQVGKQAPDIAAKDMDGVEFKLSDYRGKVVLLDFWGFW